MPKPKQHQEKADSSRAFLNSISDKGPADWMAIIAFYTAVHLVEKLRAYCGEHSESHEDRCAAVRVKFRAIHKEYHELFNNSLVARYGTAGQFSMPVEEVKRLLIDTYLVAIEKYVASETLKKTQSASA
jgi:hypothetical protein